MSQGHLDLSQTAAYYNTTSLIYFVCVWVTELNAEIASTTSKHLPFIPSNKTLPFYTSAMFVLEHDMQGEVSQRSQSTSKTWQWSNILGRVIHRLDHQFREKLTLSCPEESTDQGGFPGKENKRLILFFWSTYYFVCNEIRTKNPVHTEYLYPSTGHKKQISYYKDTWHS